MRVYSMNSIKGIIARWLILSSHKLSDSLWVLKIDLFPEYRNKGSDKKFSVINSSDIFPFTTLICQVIILSGLSTNWRKKTCICKIIFAWMFLLLWKPKKKAYMRSTLRKSTKIFSCLFCLHLFRFIFIFRTKIVYWSIGRRSIAMFTTEKRSISFSS